MAVGSTTIQKLDQLQVSRGQEKYTYTEVNWVLALVIHELIRLGQLNEEPTSWSNVEELTNLDHRYHRNGKRPWVRLSYYPSFDRGFIPRFTVRSDKYV